VATGLEFKEFIEDQLSDLEGISFRKMMGEYLIYRKGKIVAYLCDDRLLVKPVPSALKLLPQAERQKPYEGAKEMLLVENPEDRELLKSLIEAMEPELPAPGKGRKR